jgi:uncharacterized SAM-binding protein YcdF (DUF218 family)
MWSRLRSWRGQTPSNPRARRRRISPRSAFVLGVISVFGARAIINGAPFADLLVRPLVLSDRPGPADAIVVLGAGVTAQCSPNLSGIRRVVMATELFRRGLAAHVVFTGGRREGSNCTIADTMARFGGMMGMPVDRVHIESASTNTWENAHFSRPILEKLQARRLLIVTDRLHVRRAAMMFTNLGYTVGWSAVPVSDTLSDNVSMLYWGAREYAALAYYRLRMARREAPAAGRTAARAAVGRKS